MICKFLGYFVNTSQPVSVIYRSSSILTPATLGTYIQRKYLNNIVEQDHRFINKRVRSMLGMKSFRTATLILRGIEAMHMIKKGQLHQKVNSAQNEVEVIHKLFRLAA